jgi:flagellar protein FliO/FliZ
MQWLSDLPFGDNHVLQYGFLAACGIAALVVLAIVYRLVFAHRLRVPGGRTRQPRLGLVDAFSLDGQRQLVLVRRDNVEHLIMIGGPNDVLVESQINRALAPARENNLTPTAATPNRRTEPVAVPPPAPAAAPVASAPALAPPKARPAPAAEVRPIRPQSAASEAAPVTATPAPAPSAAPVSSASPAPAASAEASAPSARLSQPAVAKAADPAQSAPIPTSRPQPRPAPGRPSMPPPIPPANRANVARLTDSQPEATPAVSPASNPPPIPAVTPAAPAPSAPPSALLAKAKGPESAQSPYAARSDRATQAANGEPSSATGELAKGERADTTPKPPNRSGPAQAVEVSATMSAVPLHPPPPAKAEVKFDHLASAPVAVMPSTDQPQAAQRPAAREKLATKTEDPFAGLDTLEAEMARLLGREKPD